MALAPIPNNFPNRQLVYYYYRILANLEEFDLLLNKLRETVRRKMEQNDKTHITLTY